MVRISLVPALTPLYLYVSTFRSLLLLLLVVLLLLLLYRIKKNEMGGVCGTYGGEERCIQGFGGET